MSASRFADDVEVAMMATERQQPYVHHSLASLFAQDDVDALVRVVVCGDDDTFLGSWANDRRVYVETLRTERYARYADYNIYRRITETFIRCVEGAAKRGRGLVLLQDDVALAKGWLQTVRVLGPEAKRQVSLTRRKEDAPVVLSLFSPQKIKAAESPLSPYPPRRFYGNVGLYMSAEVPPKLAPFARQHLGEMDDMVVKRFLRAGEAFLFAVNPNIVQHTGDASTHGGGFYRSPTFDPKGHRLPVTDRA